MINSDPIKYNENLTVKIKNFINGLKHKRLKHNKMKNVFSKIDYLKPVNFIDVCKITDVSHMFNGCKTLKSVEENNGYTKIK
jgi:vacuolar-type H+-ATPase subunit C/Vma6